MLHILIFTLLIKGKWPSPVCFLLLLLFSSLFPFIKSSAGSWSLCSYWHSAFLIFSISLAVNKNEWKWDSWLWRTGTLQVHSGKHRRCVFVLISCYSLPLYLTSIVPQSYLNSCVFNELVVYSLLHIDWCMTSWLLSRCGPAGQVAKTAYWWLEEEFSGLQQAIWTGSTWTKGGLDGGVSELTIHQFEQLIMGRRGLLLLLI